ncbi:uncharacterized protein LOC117643935 [Thrips palmi]|uniref:Guanylate cyclase n=1 Tax=Thrips palmi TaxID=161013 RepID=A0A6P8YGY5_THRPL|nr:uncharacterized protein LOC117643935 [Thrips palmi]
MVVFLKEQCQQPALNLQALQRLVRERALKTGDKLAVTFVPRTELCGPDETSEVAALLAAFSDNSTRAVVGSFDAKVCGMLDVLANMHSNKIIITWGCPEQELLPGTGSMYDTKPRVRRLLPPLAAIVQGTVKTVTFYRMRTAAIVTSGVGWWQLAAQALDLALQAADVEVKHRVFLPQVEESDEAMEKALLPLIHDTVRVVVLCVPMRSAQWARVVSAVDRLALVDLPTTALLALQPTSATPFMMHDPSLLVPEEKPAPRNPGLTKPPAPSSAPSPLPAYLINYRRNGPTLPMFVPVASWSAKTKMAVLVLAAMDPGLRIDDAFLKTMGCPDVSCPQLPEHLELWHHIQRSWDLLTRTGKEAAKPYLPRAPYTTAVPVITAPPTTPLSPTAAAHQDAVHQDAATPVAAARSSTRATTRTPIATAAPASNTSMAVRGATWSATLVVVDWIGSRWRPLLKVRVGGGNASEARVEALTAMARAWPRWKPAGTPQALADTGCEFGDESSCDEASFFSGYGFVAALVAVAAVLLGGLVVLASHVRQRLRRARMSQGPGKILLQSSDLVFPHVQHQRGVDEGMEAMLSCWLHQLQEFGGPEVEKTDALKGSNGSLKSGQLQAPPCAVAGKSPESSVSAVKKKGGPDPKARYNGDLVQLKELPVAGGSFELRTKAMDVLLTLHGLRHENMNTMLGCLLDPARPSLVFEWGSRGSLMDVLVQDDIKLDWSFRLSLLTDLVRGMKYLHSTPIKVHGRLSSRNCVVDARWVLKITDFGLPCFYEAQGITPAPQDARDLLWTAPELLRDEALRRKGTQPGDVYSFSIVMQEVVLRGEPFCVLQLKPEEIIEKLKRPPPLIRPSVSKGAAPPEAINIMKQCWAELPDLRPDFNVVFEQFKILNQGRKVNFVDTMFQLLEKYSNNLEELIRERTDQLDCEKKKTEQLLYRMLPIQVAEKLKMGMPVLPENFQEVTIYFSDIVGFTAISCHSTPNQVVDLLNDLYTCFDATINAYTVYKVETIGDAYMVVGGLPVRVDDHADQVATMALDLLHQSGRFQIRHLPQTPLRLRIGLHTGPCCAGVVGLTMPRFCLFGDTVNTASRMESTGSAWRIHISEATKDKLDDSYDIEYRGMTELKGKGLMPTYWLLGRKGFEKELPTPPPIRESHGLDESLLLPAPLPTPPTQSPVRASPASPQPPEGSSSEPSSAAVKRKSFESCNSGEAPQAHSVEVVCRPHPLQALQSAISAADAQPADARASRMLVCASIDNERTPSRRGSLQLATESAKISLCTMSVKDSRHSSREVPDELDAISPAPLGPHAVTSPGMTTPLSASELAMDRLLGLSYYNPPGTWRSSSTNLQNPLPQRPKKAAAFVEEDLSAGFNTYRCLSPHDPPPARLAALQGVGRGFLKRQYSLDRGDDPAGSAARESSAPRALHKQNSAGAAPDLHRIEEVPGRGLPHVHVATAARTRGMPSLSSNSSESLA